MPRFFCAEFECYTDLLLLELDLLLDLALPQQLSLQVVGHVGNRRVEKRAQDVDYVLQ